MPIPPSLSPCYRRPSTSTIFPRHETQSLQAPNASRHPPTDGKTRQAIRARSLPKPRSRGAAKQGRAGLNPPACSTPWKAPRDMGPRHDRPTSIRKDVHQRGRLLGLVPGGEHSSGQWEGRSERRSSVGRHLNLTWMSPRWGSISPLGREFRRLASVQPWGSPSRDSKSVPEGRVHPR